MTGLRGMLVRSVIVWLLCQATTIAVGAAASWKAVPDADVGACTCEHEAGMMCPMHRRPASATRCLIGNGHAHPDVLVAGWLLHGVGFVPAQHASIPQPPQTNAAVAKMTVRWLHLLPPDPLPPRA